MKNIALKYDLVVIGGGISGISCAYTAAKAGLKVLMAEENNYLGGLVTGALVIPSMKTESKYINQEFWHDLIYFSKKYDAQITYGDKNSGWFNPILLKIVFEQMLKSVGCEILFETKLKNKFIDKKNIKKIELDIKTSNKILSIPIESIYYVDATGDGNFSAFLGCEFLPDENINQSLTLRFMVSGVDLEKFSDFLLSVDKDKNVTTSYLIAGQRHLSTAYTWDNEKKWALEPYFKKAVKNGDLKESDCDYFQIFTVAFMPHTIAFNCPKIKSEDITIASGYSRGLMDAREAVIRLLNFCKKYFAGFDDAYISNIADITGFREFRRVKCKYTYTVDDIKMGKKFKKPVLFSNYPIDIHSDKKDNSILKKTKGYYLPLESLMSYDFDNLFIVGRCLGADFASQAALRVQPSCASMGEGTAKEIISRCKHLAE